MVDYTNWDKPIVFPCRYVRLDNDIYRLFALRYAPGFPTTYTIKRFGVFYRVIVNNLWDNREFDFVGWVEFLPGKECIMALDRDPILYIRDKATNKYVPGPGMRSWRYRRRTWRKFEKRNR